MRLEQERESVVNYCRHMLTHGLTKGTGGNISIYKKKEGLIAVSPSGVEYSAMRPEDVPLSDLEGHKADGALKPSSELGLHLALYRARPDFGAVVHTHSTFATTLACAHLDLPAIHFLIGCAGADTVPCIPYYPFGSEALASAAAGKLAGVPGLCALLLGNHGLICGGPDIASAFNTAEEIEFTAELYYRTLLLNRPLPILNEGQMREALERFASYGQK